MKSIQKHVGHVLVVAIGLTVALLAYADAQDPVAADRASAPDAQELLPRTPRAIEAEAAIARTDLGARVEAALGDGFGGVWFEPSIAQMEVGVTSPAAGRLAETVAAQAGLSEFVTEIPVASSWAQLDSAQTRWNHRLTDLLEHGQVATALLPDRNAVSIELGSSVPSSQRATLERKAARDSVDIEIRLAPYARLEGTPRFQCKAFKADEAFCDPTIPGGVTIKGPVVVNTEEEGEAEAEEDVGLPKQEVFEQEGETKAQNWCTSGPAVILKDAMTKADQTKTFILTAGHCINEKKDGGGVGGKWVAIEKQGPAKGEKEIGTALAYINSKTDIGLIEVNTTTWAKAKDPIPVVPTIARWVVGSETDPFAVIDEKKPMLKTQTCQSGQSSGITCGEIVTTDQTLKMKGVVVTENLMEVKGTTLLDGDSGDPWFNKAEYEKTPRTGYIEGTGVGEKTKTKAALFQSLETSLEKLKSERGYDLVLLTTKNEKRHGPVKAGKYPATVHASTTAQQTFKVEAGTIECKESTFDGILPGASTTLTVTPTYKACTTGFGGATIEMEGCTYLFHVTEKTSTDNYRAYADVTCPAGKSIKVTAATCKFEVKAQNELETTDLIDDTSASPKKDITVRPTVKGIAYTVTQDGFLCPFNGTGEKTGGEYSSDENITATGQNPSESSEKIDIEVADQ